MRRFAAVALASALAVHAFAGDPPKDDAGAVRTVSLEDLQAELQAIDESDATTVQRIARRRKLADARLVRREGRIRDVRPTVRNGQPTVAVDIRDLQEGERLSLVLAPQDAATVEDWNRGDGVAWVDRPVVNAAGDVDFEAVATRASELIHVAVPGPERELALREADSGPKRPTGTGASLKTWLRLLAESVHAGDWHRAWLVWRLGEIADRTWLVPAHVVALETGAVVVSLDAAAPEWPEWPKEAARCGLARADETSGALTRRIEPRPSPAPAVGDAVTVEIDVAAFRSLEVMKTADGVFVSRASLARDEPDPPPASAGAPRPLVNPAGKPAEFLAWIEKFAAAAHDGDTKAATLLWSEAAKKTWVFPAVIKSAAGGRFEGRFCRDAFFKGTVSKKEIDPVTGSGWVRTVERAAGMWGFDPKKNHEFVVADPELAASLRVNMFVDVLIELDPEGAAAAMQGPFPAALTVWRLSGAARKPVGGGASGK